MFARTQPLDVERHDDFSNVDKNNASGRRIAEPVYLPGERVGIVSPGFKNAVHTAGVDKYSASPFLNKKVMGKHALYIAYFETLGEMPGLLAPNATGHCGAIIRV